MTNQELMELASFHANQNLLNQLPIQQLQNELFGSDSEDNNQNGSVDDESNEYQDDDESDGDSASRIMGANMDSFDIASDTPFDIE